MTYRETLYHRTDAGNEAARCAASRLPEQYRVLLHSIRETTPFGEVRASARPDRELLGHLEDLEAIGLIESVSADWLAELYDLGCYVPFRWRP
jgi:hypothetical protein